MFAASLSFRFYVKLSLESLGDSKCRFCHFEDLNFVKLVNISLQKVLKFIKTQNSEPLNVLKWQMQILRP